jgi:hypothetical protein
MFIGMSTHTCYEELHLYYVKKSNYVPPSNVQLATKAQQHYSSSISSRSNNIITYSTTAAADAAA